MIHSGVSGMAATMKIRRIGNSVGLILPKEVAE